MKNFLWTMLPFCIWAFAFGAIAGRVKESSLRITENEAVEADEVPIRKPFAWTMTVKYVYVGGPLAETGALPPSLCRRKIPIPYPMTLLECIQHANLSGIIEEDGGHVYQLNEIKGTDRGIEALYRYNGQFPKDIPPMENRNHGEYKKPQPPEDKP